MSTQPLFDDNKDPGALRTIGEVGAALGIKPHVLRYWEDQFPQLQPLKRAGGRRLYRPEDVAMVEQIARLTGREGYTLKGAKAAIAGGAGLDEARGEGKTEAEPAAPSADFIARLKAVRAELAAALTG